MLHLKGMNILRFQIMDTNCKRLNLLYIGPEENITRENIE